MITEFDRARLNKLLGMLTSDFDGERSNAAQMIAKMAARYKMSIPAMCGAPPERSTRKRRSKEHADTELNNLRDVVRSHLDDLTEWEQEFATDIIAKYASDDELTQKQMTVLRRLVAKAELIRHRRKREQESA